MSPAAKRTKPVRARKPVRATKPARSVKPAAIVGYSGKPTIDKLGVKPGMSVAVLGLEGETDFLAELGERVGAFATGRPKKDTEVVLLRVDSERELAKLAALERTIRRNGMIWVVWPKGQPHIKEDHVRGAALRQGLVDVKVCAFSPTLSALKLVIPVARR